MHGIIYRDVLMPPDKTPAEGRRYVRIDVSWIFRDMNYDWFSGRSYIEQMQGIDEIKVCTSGTERATAADRKNRS